MKTIKKMILFYVTVPDEECGKKIAQHLLNKKLIVCANILPAHQSIYTWDHSTQTSTENIMILKTFENLSLEVEKEILSQHPYDCPCVLQIPVLKANSKFYDWAFMGISQMNRT